MKKYRLIYSSLICLLVLTGCAEATVKVSKSTLKVCNDLKYVPPEGEPITVSNSTEHINASVTWWINLVINTQENMTPEQLIENKEGCEVRALQELNRKVKSVARLNYQIVEEEDMATLLEQVYDYPIETRTDEEIYEYIAPIYNKMLDICQFWELPKSSSKS